MMMIFIRTMADNMEEGEEMEDGDADADTKEGEEDGTDTGKKKKGENKKPATCLPKFVWVDFGKGYTGPSFFPNNPERKGWFPVRPLHAREYSNDKEHTRTMLLLKLSWAWTIWKAQGQTIKGKVVMNLGKTERECGLSYVAFSRATRLRDVGIVGGFTFERFTRMIKKHPKMHIREGAMGKLRNKVKLTIKRLNDARRPRRERLARRR